MQFKSDNTYELSFPDKDIETGAYALNSDNTKLTIDNGFIKASLSKVTIVDPNTIILSIEEEQEVNLKGGGTLETLLVITNLTLTK